MEALVEARFVGGAVRNAMLGAPVNDIDIAVPMPPEEARARLEARGIQVVPTGIAHGTVTAISGPTLFEVTSLRRDVETDGRRAVVAFTDDWAEDAFRRDFTINALYAALDGEVFDYATGIEDLIAGRVRFMGDPAARIAEDYLRVLRLFRFHAWYGRGEIDPPGLRAAAAARDRLGTLSAERVAKELLRLLEAADPAPVLRVMAAAGLVSTLLPGAVQLTRLERLAAIDSDNFFPPDPLLRLAALLEDSRAAAEAAADRLKLSNADRARLCAALGGDEKIVSYLSVKEVRRLLYRMGRDRFRDRVRLHWPRFPLTGREVMLAGVPEGPAVGHILAEVEDWWVEGDFSADAFALAERLKAIVQARDWA
jgi:poly(A) polymerase